MRTQTYIQKGLLSFKNNDVDDKTGLFSLNKFIKRVLSSLHVPFVDDCCTTTPDEDVTKLPVIYNKTAGHFYYYDPVTKLPVQITGF